MVFLSAVTREFAPHRKLLKTDLSLPAIKVQEQDDLVQTGGKLLSTIDTYIRDACDAVVHLIGRETGATVKPDELKWLRNTYPDLQQRLSVLAEDLNNSAPELSYTQLEAWLALYHGRRCHFYVLSDLREHPLPDDHPQQLHLKRLQSLGEHRGYFRDEQHLCRQVLRDLNDLLPKHRAVRGSFVGFSPAFLSASLLLICGLLGGIWWTIVTVSDQTDPQPHREPHRPNPSVLFLSDDTADDIERLQGAQAHDIPDLARECTNPLWGRLADRLEQQPEILLKVARTFIEVQPNEASDILNIPPEEMESLSKADQNSVLSLAGGSQNVFLRQLATEFSDAPETLLMILREICTA